MNIQDAINMVIDRMQDKREALVNAKDALFPEYGRLNHEHIYNRTLSREERADIGSKKLTVADEINKHYSVIKRLDNAIKFVKGLTAGVDNGL
jgi:hypothetical protein